MKWPKTMLHVGDGAKNLDHVWKASAVAGWPLVACTSYGFCGLLLSVAPVLL